MTQPMPRQGSPGNFYSNQQNQYDQTSHNNFYRDTFQNFSPSNGHPYPNTPYYHSSDEAHYDINPPQDQRRNLPSSGKRPNLNSKAQVEKPNFYPQQETSELGAPHQSHEKTPKRQKFVGIGKREYSPEEPKLLQPPIKFEERNIPCLSEFPEWSEQSTWDILSTEPLKIPARKHPGDPNSVKTIDILANHFAISIPENFPNLHCYSFEMNREAGNKNYVMIPKKLRVAVITKLISGFNEENNNFGVFTDYSSKIFSAKQLSNLHQEYILIHGQDLQGHDEEMGCTFHIKIAKEGIMPGWNCSRDLGKTEKMLNTMLRSVMLQKFTSLGSDFINLQRRPEKIHDDSQLSAFKGFKASFNLTNGLNKFFINIDVNRIPAYSSIKVSEVIKDYFKRAKGKDTRFIADDLRTWSEDDRRDASKLLENMKIIYPVSDNGTTYCKVIQRISPQSASKILVRNIMDEQSLSVYEHHSKKGIKLQYPNGPVLKCAGKDQAEIPVELCTVKLAQPFSQSASSSGRYNKRLAPTQRHQGINEALSELSLEGASVFGEYGVKLLEPSRMHEIKARKIASPTLAYGSKLNEPSSKKIALIQPENGEWDIWTTNEEDKFSLHDSGKINSWAVLNATDLTDKFLNKFIKTLVDRAATKNMILPAPIGIFPVKLESKSGYENNNVALLEDEFKKIKVSLSASDSFVLAIINKKGSPHYNQVKQAAELKVGILTQCIVKINVEKSNGWDKIMGNLLLEINSKLGHVNHLVLENPDFPGSFKLLDYPVMILGADVSHPPPGSRNIVGGVDNSPPSYVGVSASIDRTGMPYMMHVEAQKQSGKGSAEVIQNLEEIVKKFILAFQHNARMFPLKIIYLRDGVGDSQFDEVLQVELTAIRKACNTWKGFKPQITFLVVQKRHKTRFFVRDPENPEVYLNPEAGTVVDEDIVSCGTTDFYLISHKGRLQGTSRPTRYQVLWDDSNFSMNEIETLTYYMCHMYARCTQSVKIPAPTYYAHWAAKRAEALCQGWGDEFYSNPEKLNRELEKREKLDCAKA
ncbi:unnamed protein product [Allacma fusca]|uniref:Uncharacterized protein n=1 Tax=Allacma fusca TaxID=39272 RepID=A0A8J2PS34_9HEXA|nr:unnamed protein product [Allacma fusca]